MKRGRTEAKGDAVNAALTWTRNSVNDSKYVALPWFSDDVLKNEWCVARILSVKKGSLAGHGHRGEVLWMRTDPDLPLVFHPGDKSKHIMEFSEHTAIVPLPHSVSGLGGGAIQLSAPLVDLVWRFERLQQARVEYDILRVRQTKYAKKVSLQRPVALYNKATQNGLIAVEAARLFVRHAIVLDAADMQTTCKLIEYVPTVQTITVPNDSADAPSIARGAKKLSSRVVEVIPTARRLSEFLHDAPDAWYDCLVRDGCSKLNREVEDDIIEFLSRLARFPCLVTVTVNCRGKTREAEAEEVKASLTAIGSLAGAITDIKYCYVYDQMVFVLAVFSHLSP